ncbi:hypothetical protein KKA93_02215 [Patescibacteria group bacterium]|nr:hypothetical protein [Patescibacteria group bacterium]MBU1663393.1 hypothetical protein [Patescibacteria group bacterium]MBU1933750.1 hypothetical protein [Patescibacteria group bacterium]MBU2008043.1 hypothetical protein [Patescibacteria group bacterium]MBU2233737.1 hypothetical protein [Patescibacteria group bacterium]
MTEEKTTKTPLDPDIKKNKTVAALSYVWILFLIPLLGKKRSTFSQFHAKQGLVLFLLSFLSWFPLIGWLIGLAIIIISIIGILKCMEGAWWKAPYIYGLSKKINL